MLVSDTERVFWPTVSVPAKPFAFVVGSVNVNVPGVENVQDELCPASRLSLHAVLSTTTW